MRTRMAAAVLLGGALLGACAGRQHLTDTHGRAMHTALSAQRANPTAAAHPKVTGLDSQEASIISESYRASLTPKGVKVEDQPVIFLAPQTPAPRPTLPPPSVPK